MYKKINFKILFIYKLIKQCFAKVYDAAEMHKNNTCLSLPIIQHGCYIVLYNFITIDKQPHRL